MFIKTEKKVDRFCPLCDIRTTHTVTTIHIMRTKALFLSAIALASSLVVASAQVYSQNVVGYYQLTLTNGFQMVANQLDLDGTGTNNTVETVFGTNGWANLTKIFAFDVGTAQYATVTFFNGVWSGAGKSKVNTALSTGQGVFMQIPASGSPVTVTIVGNVMQGTLVTPINTAGFAIVSSPVPQGGNLATDFGTLTAVNLDKIYRLKADQSGYDTSTYFNGNWSGATPTVSVGQAFWYKGQAGSSWTRTFTVN